MGQNFMDALVAGEVKSEIVNLCTVYNDTLFKLADISMRELEDRLSSIPVTDYVLASYSFSTPGVNDLCYRYVTSGKVGSGPAFKIMFNPVKVEGNWFLTMKDGYMSSQDLHPALQIDPMAPAPNPIVLNKSK